LNLMERPMFAVLAITEIQLLHTQAI